MEEKIIRKLDNSELDQISGGRGENLFECACPGCGHVYKVSSQTTKINCPCGTSFYPTGR